MPRPFQGWGTEGKSRKPAPNESVLHPQRGWGIHPTLRTHVLSIGAALLALLYNAPARATDPYVKGTAVVIKTVDSEPVQGLLLQLTRAGGAVVRTIDRQERRIPTDELVRLTTQSMPSREVRRPLRLSLRGGDRLCGRLAGPAEPDRATDAVEVDAAGLGRLTIPLDQLARLDTARASLPEHRNVISLFAQTAVLEEDRILLTNSDVVRGFVSSIDAENVVLEGAMGDTRIALDLILTISFGGAEPAPLTRPYFVVSLMAGAIVSTPELDWSASGVEVFLRLGQRIRIEPDSIQRIDLVGGRWEWLGERPPISFQHTPMLVPLSPRSAPSDRDEAAKDRARQVVPALALDWPFAVDRNVIGGPLIVGGETFEHGVGVHSRSSLTYDLQGAYREFVTSMGIDDDSGPYADVTAVILVDGKRRWFQENIRRGTLLDPIRVDVRKANRIELVVDYGDNGDVQDRFNWLDAALIR